MNKKKTTWKVKPVIFIVSLIFFLALLEGGMRIAGRMILPERQSSPKEIPLENPVILCVGDSFTWGGRVEREQSYPIQLGQILNKAQKNKPWFVTNNGQCESNSHQLLQSLPDWLEEYKPAVVVLLIGSANRFNTWGSGLHPTGTNALVDGIRNLRIYKMGRLIMLGLKGRLLLSNVRFFDFVFTEEWGQPTAGYITPSRFHQAKNYLVRLEEDRVTVDDEALVATWDLIRSNNIALAISATEKAVDEKPESLERLCTLGYLFFKNSDYTRAEETYKRALSLKPSSEFALMFYAHFLFDRTLHHAEENNYTLVLERALQAIAVDPNEYHHYYMLSKAYDHQSRYDSKAVLNRLEGIAKDHPEVKEVRLFQNTLDLFTNKEAYEKRISQWLRGDLEKVATLCQKTGAKLVVQNYPVPYPMANAALEYLATTHKLPFVDNTALFTELLTKFDRKTLLFDDDHATPLGHNFMAENIYQTLITSGVVPFK